MIQKEKILVKMLKQGSCVDIKYDNCILRKCTLFRLRDGVPNNLEKFKWAIVKKLLWHKEKKR